jgi:hypothetical protein
VLLQVAVDPVTGDVLVAAEGELTSPTMTALSAGGSSSRTAPNQGLTDIFLAKYNRDGIVQWMAHVGGRGIDQNPFVAVRPDSRIYLVSQLAAVCSGKHHCHAAFNILLHCRC